MTVTYKESINEKLRDIDIKLQNLEINDEEKVSLNEQKNEYHKQLEEDLEEDLEGDTKENGYDTDIDTEEEIEYESIYFKYWFDNCSTIDDVLTGIEALKCKFEQWKVEGHVLSQKVNNGYCFIDKIYKE